MLLCFILTLFLADHSPVACFSLDEGMESYTEPFLTVGPTILYTDRLVAIDGEHYQVVMVEQQTIRTEELRSHYDCLFAFAEYPGNRASILTTLILISEDGDTLVLDIIQQKNRTNIILEGTRWNTTECTPPFDGEEVLYPEVLEYADTFFPYPTPKDTTDYTIVAAEMETVTEQVLSRSAYTVLDYSPPTFESAIETYLSKETNVCTDFTAEYDTVTETALLTSAYETLEIQLPVFETVTEQVLARGAMLELEVMPAEISPGETILNMAPEYTALTTSWIDGCDALGLTCVEYQLQQVPRHDTVLQTGHYICPQGYESDEGLCTKEVTIPAQYATLTYEKLIQPTTSISSQVEATYETLTKYLITNKSEIPDSCIESHYLDRKITLLSQPATIDVREVPATYETRAYDRMSAPPELIIEQDSVGIHYTKTYVLSDARLSTIGTLPKEYGRDSLLIRIGEKLATLGYEGSTSAERLYQYLLARDQPLMMVTRELLDSLQLSLTTYIDNEERLDSLSDKEYRKMINRLSTDGPYSFRQTILRGDCQQVDVVSASILETDLASSILRSGSDIIGSLFESGSNTSVRALDTNVRVEVSTMDLGECDSTYLLSQAQDTAITLDILDIYINEQGRKVIEFDMPINTCHLPAANLQFIEGLGSNAGLDYRVVDGVVQGYMICSEEDGEVVYTAPGFSGSCLSPLTAVSDSDLSDVVVYPNPTSGRVYLPKGSVCISVSDSQGAKHSVDTEAGVLDLTDLPSGMYSISLLHASAKYSHHRIVLVH